MGTDKSMIEGANGAKPAPSQSHHPHQPRDPAGMAAERFRETLSKVSGKAKGFQQPEPTKPLDKEVREPDLGGIALSDQQNATQEHDGSTAKEHSTPPAGLVAHSGASAIQQAQDLGPVHGAAATASDQALVDKFAAAMQLPLAGLSARSQSVFCVTIPGNGEPLSANVHMGSDGKLTVALALPGLTSPQKEALARDLKRHLTIKGFIDNRVRIEQTLSEE